MTSPPVAVVLLSGGLDSTTCLAIAGHDGFEPVTLSFRYGQRHTVEIDRARAIAAEAGVEHLVVDIDLAAFGGSALTDRTVAVPKRDRPAPTTTASPEPTTTTPDQFGGGEPIGSDIPITYVPARNTIFLAFALGVAEVRGAADLYIGVNAVDYSGYPDCRPEFIAAFERTANLATRAGVEGRHLAVHTPLIGLTKGEIIRWGTDLGVDYAATSTCYDPTAGGRACGRCEACHLRARGFAEAGLADPTVYAEDAR